MARDHEPGAVVEQGREQVGQLGPGAGVLSKVGSSRASRRGRVAIAVATESRRCSPPLSVNGFAAASRSSRSRPSSSSTRRSTSAASTPARRGPIASSSRTVEATSWWRGSWKTDPIRVTRRRGGQRCGSGPAAVGERLEGPHPSGRRTRQPRQRQQQGRLAAAVGPDERRAPAGADAQVDPGEHRRSGPVPRHREVLGHQQPVVGGRGTGSRPHRAVLVTGHPHALRREPVAVPLQHR